MWPRPLWWTGNRPPPRRPARPGRWWSRRCDADSGDDCSWWWFPLGWMVLFAPFHAVGLGRVVRPRRGDADHIRIRWPRRPVLPVMGISRRWTTPAGHHGGVLLLMPGDPM